MLDTWLRQLDVPAVETSSMPRSRLDGIRGMMFGKRLLQPDGGDIVRLREVCQEFHDTTCMNLAELQAVSGAGGF